LRRPPEIGAPLRRIVRAGLPALLGLQAFLIPAALRAAETRPNFVIFMTDDQRWDTMWAMPLTTKRLAKSGVTFKNAFATTPLCCPDRASLLSGGYYAHNTQVLTNGPLNGGATAFKDSDGLAVKLHRAGYRTALIGKYLNGYHLMSPRVPPGWTFWRVLEGGNFFVDATLVYGSGGAVETTGISARSAGYSTDLFREMALQFIRETEDRPFFLMFTPYAPHKPAIPAPGDEKLFSDFVWRGREGGPPPDIPETELDSIRNQLRSLQAVDRAVDAIVQAVEDAGLSDRTVFFFTSDNGFLWGERGKFGKQEPFEESIRVPFLVRMPGAAPGEREVLVAPNLDIGPTVLELAGLEGGTDGISLVPLLRGAASRDRTLLIENFGLTESWAGLRGTDWKFVEKSNGAKLFYDLEQDPLELSNVYRGGGVRGHAHKTGRGS
jgi:arylsulfatase A-like enzyme